MLTTSSGLAKEVTVKIKFTMAISSKQRVKNVPSNLILKVTLSQEIRSWCVGNSGRLGAVIKARS